MLSNKSIHQLGMQSFAFLVVFLLSGCASSKKAQSQEPAEVIITQQRLECMGLCPVYELRIYSNGKVDFFGVKNVPKEGDIEFQLSNSDFDNLVSSFEEIDFFNLEKEYSKNISDGSTTYISYKSGEDELKIMDYYGAPKKLKELEEKVESLVFKYLEE